MATQTYEDGSLNLIKNEKCDKSKLNSICEALKKLTEPEKMNELINQMYQQGILNEFDLMELKRKGIYQASIGNSGIEQSNSIFYERGEFSISGDDELDEIDL